MFSKYEVYTTTASLYCYPGTNILRNKAGLHDAKLLKQMETDITAIKQYELLLSPMAGRFTKTHLFRIHKYLFCDIYPFAGKLRREQISKGNTVFYPPASLSKELDRVFNFIKSNQSLTSLKDDDLIEALAYVMAELNIIHPFREGNGRTIREFIRLLALHNGLKLDWGNVNYQVLLDASIKSVDDCTVLVPILKQTII